MSRQNKVLGILTGISIFLLILASCGGGGNSSSSNINDNGNNNGADTSPPTIPANLIATTVSSTLIGLSWDASTDDTAVTGYRIYRGGAEITTVTGTTYADTGLTANTAYAYTVSAFDAAGNNSGQTVSANATTLSSAGATLTVDPAGAGDYITIGEAVTAAASGDSIYILNGTYHESVNTSKTGLTITGESKQGVIWTSMQAAVGSPDWSQTGGYSNVYQASASDVASTTVRGIVDGNYTGQYAEKTSLSDVDAIPGTFYELSGTLYVHTSNGASPVSHVMWYTTNAYQDTLIINGGTTIANISFIGSTQYGVWIRSSVATIGDNTISDCVFKASALSATVSGGNTAGTLTIKDSEILYSLSPTYDPNYSVFTDAQGTVHSYRGTGLTTNYLDTVNIENSAIRFTRSATGDANSRNFNIQRSLITDITVHPHMHNMAFYNTLRIENSIYAMYGSTSGPRVSSSASGFNIYLINNTVYAGENPVIGGGDKRWFSATDGGVTPAALYIYNNLFIRDKDASSNNAIPLSLEYITLNTIQMDNNYYTRGSVNGASPNDNYIDFGGTTYTLSEWQAYTLAQSDPKDINSVYEPVPANAKLAVVDYQDTGNANFGNILSGSPVIDLASTIYAPAIDFVGTIRPQGALPDIGAYEYVP